MTAMYTNNPPTPRHPNATHRTTTSAKLSTPGVQKQNTPALLTLDEKADQLLKMTSLTVDEAREVANALEKLLDLQCQITLNTRRRCFRGLVRLCGEYGVLPESYIIPEDKIEKLGDAPVATGGFSEVWPGMYEEEKAVAIKIIKYYTAEGLQTINKSFCREVITLKRLSHPNILELTGVMMDNGLYAMVTPWMQNGNIVDYVREEPQINPLELLEGATLGLQYLHSMDLAHGDLKESNILISEDGHACLTDVGTTRVAGDMSSATATTQTSTTEGGLTVRWSPPEMLDPERFGAKRSRPTKKSDVYSMAMTIYQVSFLQHGLSASPPVLPPSTAKNEMSLEHVPGGPPVERSQIPTTLEKQHTQEVPASLPETQLGKPTLTVSRKDEIEVTMPGVKANSPSVLGLTAPASSRLPVDSGIPSQLQPGDTNRTSKLLEPFKDGQQALQRLVSGSAPRDELSSLIGTVVSNVRADAVVDHLQGIDAQTFVDVLDQALDGPDFPLEIRNECVRLLYTTCAGHTLLPRSMCLELPGDTVGDVQCRGGFGIVSKRGYRGQEVAVKALRGLSSEKMSKRFWKEVITWRAVQHPNVLPLVGVVMTRDRFSMVSEWMANGNIKKFVEARQSANRYKLLADATKGLIHVHCQGIIHGDLKAANILINQNGHACLADFGLATIASDTTNTTFSDSLLGGGTTRWKSPELFDPEEFGLTERRRTKSSDCYALGMAVYEVLSGKVPFYDYQPDVVVVPKILDGDRPERPRGPWFTDDIWDTLEWCWKPMPGDRPSAEDVLHRLRKASMPSPAQMIEGPLIMDPPMQEWELHAKEKEEERMTRLLIPQ